MGLFDRKLKEAPKLAGVLADEEPAVNYNTVLDYLTGLSDKDYKKMTQSAEVYREANKKVAKIVGVRDEPTTSLLTAKPTDDEIDQALDDTLAGNFLDDDTETAKPKKEHAATAKKIEIQDK